MPSAIAAIPGTTMIDEVVEDEYLSGHNGT